MSLTDAVAMQLGDLFDWVAKETPALCRAPERLLRFADERAAPDLSDVRFHVEGAGCRFCAPIVGWPVAMRTGWIWAQSVLSDAPEDGEDRSSEGVRSHALAVPIETEKRDGPSEGVAARTGFIENWEPLRPQLVSLALSYLRSAAEAEDAVQDVALSLWRRMERNPNFRPKSAWAALFFAAVRNQCISRLRSRERARFLALDEQWDALAGQRPGGRQRSPETPSEQLSRQERTQRGDKILSEALQEFCRTHERQPKGRTLLELFERKLVGQTHREIMDALQMPEGTFHAYKGEAFRWLSERLKQADVRGSVFQSLRFCRLD